MQGFPANASISVEDAALINTENYEDGTILTGGRNQSDNLPDIPYVARITGGTNALNPDFGLLFDYSEFPQINIGYYEFDRIEARGNDGIYVAGYAEDDAGIHGLEVKLGRDRIFADNFELP